MKELVAKINEAFEAFSKDAALQVEKGNKAAGTRARKASLELEKLMKEFRKVSVEAGKNYALPHSCSIAAHTYLTQESVSFCLSSEFWKNSYFSANKRFRSRFAWANLIAEWFTRAKKTAGYVPRSSFW